MHNCSEISMGNECLKSTKPLVAIFGSSKSLPSSNEYKLAHKLAKDLSQQHINIITGGGLGIMEAANSGAIKGAGLSITVPLFDEVTNSYYSQGYCIKVSDSCHRKLIIFQNSLCYVFFPGGIGTYDELFEVLALFQKGLTPKPIILIGKAFWEKIISLIKKNILNKEYSESTDFNTIRIIDTYEDSYSFILKNTRKDFTN